MNLTNTITIGSDYLQNKVKSQYSNHQVALIREFLQNSIDADSNNIRFEFNETERILKVTDDGCGMDDFIMTYYLFQLGGSLKDQSKVNTGGFGAAKLILLFQHEYFKITSWKNGNRYHVEGVADRYSDFEITPDNGKGTVIEIKFVPQYSQEKQWDDSIVDTFNQFESKSKEYIRSCEFDCLISWNGELIGSHSKGTKFKTTKWAEFYNKPLKEGEVCSNYVNIRINGLTMFKSYISNMRSEVTVELTKDSLSILTENRDGLLMSYRRELDAIIGEFNIDKESFARLEGKTLTYQGQSNESFMVRSERLIKEFKELVWKKLNNKISQCKERGWNDEEMKLKNLRDQFDYIIDDDIMEEIRVIEDSIKQKTKPTEASTEGLKRVLETLIVKSHNIGIKEIDNEIETVRTGIMKSQTNHDFIIKINKKFNRIPKNIDPETGISPKYLKLAQIWCHSIKTLALLMDCEINFRMGNCRVKCGKY